MTEADFTLSVIASWIANKIDVYFKNKPQYTEELEVAKKIEHIIDNNSKTEVEKLSERFQKVTALMNENRGEYSKFTIAKLSEILNLQKRSILENIVNGKEEPTFDFLKIFCETFRVNYDWLNEGKGEPFYTSYLYYSPMDYFEDIMSLNPERIYFIQNKSETAQTFIMFGFSDWYYMVGTKIWHVSNHVGASGQGQIYDLYLLIRKLKENLFESKCFGLKLDKKEFWDVASGKVFPGSCLIGDMGLRGNNPWWDDFTDITHYYPIADSYESMYGKSFIDAQNIVKYQIEKYGK